MTTTSARISAVATGRFTVSAPPLISGGRSSVSPYSGSGGLNFNHISLRMATKRKDKTDLIQCAYKKKAAKRGQKYVVITNADSGYGRAVAIAAGLRGYNLFIHSNASVMVALRAVEDEIKKMGCNVDCWCYEFSKEQDHVLILEKVLQVFPRVDVVIFNEVIPVKMHMKALAACMNEVALTRPGGRVPPRVVSISTLIPVEIAAREVPQLANTFLGKVNLNAVLVPRVSGKLAGIDLIMHHGFSRAAKDMTAGVNVVEENKDDE